MRVLVVMGTRPEAVKLVPVILQLKRAGHAVSLCVTGQHRSMLEQIMTGFEVEADFDLDVMSANQTLENIVERVLNRMKPVLEQVKPDVILVQGDTSTSFAAALSGFLNKCPIGHIEAGLRTGNLRSPWPEEGNRRLIGSIADYHFAPTTVSRDNLLRENTAADRIWVTGNTVIDALQFAVDKLDRDPAFAASACADLPTFDPTKRLILVTGHRRENFGQGIDELCKALRALAERGDCELVYPVHLNPNVRGPVLERLGDSPNIKLIDPVGYFSFVSLMQRSYLIVTDSGGVQEEAPYLSKPVLVTRDTTERPEAVEAGVARLVGPNSEAIVAAATALLDDPAEYERMSKGGSPYGDGTSAARTVTLLETLFARPPAGAA